MVFNHVKQFLSFATTCAFNFILCLFNRKKCGYKSVNKTMSSPEISEDDDSFEQPRCSTHLKKPLHQEPITISSDDEVDQKPLSAGEFSSDDELPKVNIGGTADKREQVIKNLFTAPKKVPPKSFKRGKKKVPVNPWPKIEPSTSRLPEKPPIPSHKKMIGGVQVDFPVPPYGAQIALMSKVIDGISKGLNCLLESPTGSGKTLALLCGALAWQQHEKNRIGDFQAQQSLVQHPELSAIPGVAESIVGPAVHENLFTKPGFGTKNIYDKPSGSAQNGANLEGSPSFGAKRVESDTDWNMASPQKGLVSIHNNNSNKRRKITPSTTDSDTPPTLPATPEKMDSSPQQPETPKNIRQLYALVDNLRLRTSMFLHSSVPTIYYGARTHKQIQQVVKEFSRTVYCGESKMTILSSREYSCIREFDRNLYSNKNEMCKECTKKVKVPRMDIEQPYQSTNCKFFENRAGLTHEQLPPAFDLEDLVSAGHEMSACPFYAARLMCVGAQIVFCPYNYLIDPGIRSSLQIQVRGEIVILDEAHNIEDICRDSASFTITRDQIISAINELKYLSDYEFANQDIRDEILHLLKTMRSWDDWFINQTPLIQNRPVNNNEAVYAWQVDFFVKTLNNHNIGFKDYGVFKGNLEAFTAKYQADPSTFYGITQPTVAVMESICTIFSYLFRDDCKHMDDYKPALVKTVHMARDDDDNPRAWRRSQFDKTVEKEVLSLRMMCMNPAVVFEALKPARCIILSSGTLTPLTSLHSELDTNFPLQVSPSHVIPRERVWIGTLTTCPDGRPLECKSSSTNQPETQDALGQAVLWVSQVTPHGVLCFLPSYALMNKLQNRWRETGLWRKLTDIKHVFMESRNVKDHGDIMEEYYRECKTSKGALLFAVYRGKVSEGMDFKDHQARAVITVGIPYPNTFDMMVKEKMNYNERHGARRLLAGSEWLRVQAYRALNQAVGRCVRHRADWGAVLLVDSRYRTPYYTEHLSKWVRNFLGNNHHTYSSLVNSPNSLESFIQNMTIKEKEEQNL